MVRLRSQLNPFPFFIFFSLVTGRLMILDRILGDIGKDSSLKIISAKAVQSTYFIKNQGKYDKKTGQNVSNN